MPLRDRLGERPDTFRREAGADRRLAPLEQLDAALAARRTGELVGVELPNTADPATLVARFETLALIAVVFPAFTDGRGFSLARALRRLGYAGRLRAVGPLIADQFGHALACGFDEVEIPDALAARQPVGQWLAALAGAPGGLGEGVSLLEARRAAQARVHSGAPAHGETRGEGRA